MQKSQRTGLIIFALLCMMIIAAVVIKSRNAAKECGYDDPHPTEFIILETEPPLPSRTGTDKTEKRESDKNSRNRKSGKKKEGSKKPGKGKTDGSDARERQWLDEL